MQEVKVYISISGDYCAFHEMAIKVEYDITTNKIVTISPDGNFTIKAIPPKASVSVSKAIMDSKNFVNLVIDNQKNKNKNLIVNF